MTRATRTLLTTVDLAAVRHGDRTAFRVPRLHSDGTVQAWDSVSYTQLKDDVHGAATHWTQVLSKCAISPGAIVGIWLRGVSYEDVVHLFALSGAGYIAQALSTQTADAAQALLKSSGAVALISEEGHLVASELSKSTTLRVFHVPPLSAIRSLSAEHYEQPIPPNDCDSFAIFHSSGSTGSMPKLVPCSHVWLAATLEKVAYIQATFGGASVVTVPLGTVMHMGQMALMLGGLQNGATMVSLPYFPITPSDLIDMHARAGLNVVSQLGPHLARVLRESRNNPALFEVLRKMDALIYSGGPIPQVDVDYAQANGFKLLNLYGSTELSAVMYRSRTDFVQRPVPGFRYIFAPLKDRVTDSEENQSSSTSTRSPPCELIVPADAPDLPHPSLRESDGTFRTGDLFREVSPGAYELCGRVDDWITMGNAGRCDTKSIEAMVMGVCTDIVQTCFAVGTGRPSPVLFVEPVAGLPTSMDKAALAEEILQRIEPLQNLRYSHERIRGSRCIVVVDVNSLPRTNKGTIRRSVVEQSYADLLDSIFTH